ncbi:MAG: response regulator [Anaerolineales bacterium]
MAEKILIIDDDVDTLKLVGLMLERHGYEIVVASNGALGIERAKEDTPQLILLDIMMPDMDGYEVTRRLRADPALAHLPIIMFTAKTMVDDQVDVDHPIPLRLRHRFVDGPGSRQRRSSRQRWLSNLGLETPPVFPIYSIDR